MGWFSSKSDPKFFLSTVPPEPGRVSEYLGVVSGEAVIGANLFRDMFASVRDVVGATSGHWPALARPLWTRWWLPRATRAPTASSASTSTMKCWAKPTA